MIINGSARDQLFQDIEKLRLSNLSVPVFINGTDELVDLGISNLFTPTQTLEGIIDEAENLVSLKSATAVGVIFIEDAIDGLSELVVSWF